MAASASLALSLSAMPSSIARWRQQYAVTDASCDGSRSNSSARCRKGFAGLNSGGMGGSGIVEWSSMGLRESACCGGVFSRPRLLRCFW